MNVCCRFACGFIHARQHSESLREEFRQKHAAIQEKVVASRKPANTKHDTSGDAALPVFQLWNQALVCKKKIGSGAYGEVFLATIPSTSANFAVKVARDKSDPKSMVQMQDLTQEFSYLARLRHPNVLFAYSIVVTDLGERMAMVSELADASLLSWLQATNICANDVAYPIHLYFRWSLATQLSQGMSFIHSKQVLHCDVKPSNALIFMLPTLTVKLADFGLSVALNDQGVYRVDGGSVYTPNYRPPECRKRGSLLEIGKESDVWALGCLFYEVFCHDFYETLFDTNHQPLQPESYCVGEFSACCQASSLIGSMVQEKKGRRLSSEDVARTCLLEFDKAAKISKREMARVFSFHSASASQEEDSHASCRYSLADLFELLKGLQPSLGLPAALQFLDMFKGKSLPGEKKVIPCNYNMGTRCMKLDLLLAMLQTMVEAASP